jgi:uncharacterized protein (TIGR01777 family)
VDPFSTAPQRARVIDAWTASPARFREDANAEEDYALGGYRDRVVVELAQNAADAAARAGVPGRLLLALRDRTLVAANTGAPLDAAGVEALSTLRASAKRTGSAPVGPGGLGATVGPVGRFGVGFAAVVAVSDAPRIHSQTGTVAWSRARTREIVSGIPALGAELEARSGHVPVLRLPFADEPGGETGAGSAGVPVLPDGFATAVELPLRDDDAVTLVTRLLADTGPALLLALPALAEVVIQAGGVTRVLSAVHAGDESRLTVDGVPSTWRVATAGGELDAALLADRPAEERGRTSWSVRWAVPIADGVPAGRLPAGVAAVVHAPTPTDEPLGLPALLLASFPLSPDRRHVAPGPLTGFLVDRAAQGYAELLASLTPAAELLGLVPAPVAAGELDARVAGAILARLPQVPFLPPVAHPESPRAVRPRDAVVVSGGDGSLAGCLAPVLPGLVDVPARHPALAALGVRRITLAEVADLLASLDREPGWWHGLYAAFNALPGQDLAELGALPAPLADGRLVRGPRGLLLPGPGLAHPDRLAVLGLRVVHPHAAHPLLERLGALQATPRSMLDDPATRAAVAASYDKATEAYYDDEGPELTAAAVLDLLTAVNAEPGEFPWMSDLALPAADGDWYPAGELLLPDAPLAAVLAPDSPFGTVSPALTERHGAAALRAAGVLSSFGLLRTSDVELDEAVIDLDLDGATDWAHDSHALLRAGYGALPLPPLAVTVTAVRDLDLVAADRWPAALDLLLHPPLRGALTEPTRVRLPDGQAAAVPSYTAWWLRRHVRLNGRRPAELRTADSDPLLAGLYDLPDQGWSGDTGEGDQRRAAARVLEDPAIARALGVRSTLDDLLAEPGGAQELLSRLADPGRPVTRPQLRALWAALAASHVNSGELIPPDRVRAILGEKVIVADAADALVLDVPDLWPLVAGQPLILAARAHVARLADLLDLPLAGEEVPGAIESAGQRSPAPGIVRDVLPGAPATYFEHDRLIVDGVDVPWRYRDGELHAATVEGLAHGLAWAAGHWPARHLIAALLTSPDDAPRLLAEGDLDALRGGGTHMGLTYSSVVQADQQEVFAWHTRPGAITRLLPPWQPVRVAREAASVRDGQAILALPGGVRWVAGHDPDSYEPPRQFADVLRAPLGNALRWRHTHLFTPDGDHSAIVTDVVDTPVPAWALHAMFCYRHRQLAGDLDAHARARQTCPLPLTIAVTGASGLIGSALTALLRTGGHRVIQLVRRAPRDPGERQWRPQDPAADLLDGVDAVIHLAGASIAGRFTDAHKRAIESSRTGPTQALAELAARAGSARLRAFVSASATGIYGADRGDDVLTEDSGRGDGFLAGVAAAWETATGPAAAAGVRTVLVRTGIVQTPRGGTLRLLRPLFEAGLGGQLGDGTGWLPWIEIDDLLDIYLRAVTDPGLRGPVNAVAPDAVRGAEYAATLGRVLRRPARIPVPAFGPRLLLGTEGARELALASQRARPAVLTAAGHRFRYPDLEGALRHVLGRDARG